jgi:nitronate monooxygenase
MAVAVSENDGLGSLGCAPWGPETLHDKIVEMQQRTTKPFNVNFFAHRTPTHDSDSDWLAALAPHYEALSISLPDALGAGPIQAFSEDHCDIIEATRPPVVSFHFGLPDQALLARVKATGAAVLSSATTFEEGRWLQAHGCDAVIAQGFEAGGHRGMFLTDDVTTQIGTLSLVPQMVDALDIPVIAAGGIADGRAMAAALMLGAQAAQIGTAYLHTPEASLSTHYRDELASATSTTSVISNIFSGKPARVATKPVASELGPMSTIVADFPHGFAAMGPLRQAAEAKDSADYSTHYMGQSAVVHPGEAARSAATLTRQLIADCHAAPGFLSCKKACLASRPLC